MESSENPAQIQAEMLAGILQSLDMSDSSGSKLFVVDCRRFLDYNTSHIRSAVNICCSKLIKRRLREDKVSAMDLIMKQFSNCGMVSQCTSPSDIQLVLYDDSETLHLDSYDSVDGDQNCSGQSKSFTTRKKANSSCSNSSSNGNGGDDSTLITVLLQKLCTSSSFAKVTSLKGGFVTFQQRYPHLCEGAVPAADGMIPTPGRGASNRLSMTSLSQPCLPVTSQGPTRILPFLYLGSQQDAMSPDIMQRYGINHVLNLSITCPRPQHVVNDDYFKRIAVNDSYTEKLMPHFPEAFDFLEKVQENKGCVLVHCLAGISRSPTLAIAFIMHHLGMKSDEAYRFVKEKRPSISPNFNFMGQLLQFEKQLEARRHERLTKGFNKIKGTIKSNKSPLSSRISIKGLEGKSVQGEPLLFKRSLSCPMKISKDASSDKVIMNVDQAITSDVISMPSSRPNVNGKRQMESCPPAPRPGGLFSTPPTRITDDLPSPSTEFGHKLCLSAQEDSTLYGAHIMKVQTRHIPPYTAPNIGGVYSQINPFFTSFNSSAGIPNVIVDQPSSGETNPFFAHMSQEVPLGPKRRKEDSPEHDTVSPPKPRKKESRNLGNRFISQLLGKRLQWSRLCPIPQARVSFMNTVCLSKSNTQHQLSAKCSTSEDPPSCAMRRLPVKSRSESMLHDGSSMDSPESGFVDSPAMDKIRDPDRDSIGSHSSMEITVN